MTVLRTQLRGMASRPVRLLLTSLAVIVATAFAYATFLIQDVVTQSLQDSFSSTPTATSISATSVPPISTALRKRLGCRSPIARFAALADCDGPAARPLATSRTAIPIPANALPDLVRALIKEVGR